MKHIDLLPVFCIVIVINFCLFALAMVQEIRLRHIYTKNRFFPNFVLFFIMMAYFTRAVNLVYLVSKYPGEDFNRFIEKDYENMFIVYLNYLPNLFYGLASVTFLFKLISDFYTIPINVNFNEQWGCK